MGNPESNHIKDLVQRVLKPEGDDAAFNEIVALLHSFLMHISNRKFYRIPGMNSEDVYQECLLALTTKAIPDYKAEKGSFLAFAKLCIRRHIITVLKAANNFKNSPLNGSVSLDATACDDKDDGPIPVSGFISNGEENIVETLSRLEAHGLLKSQLVSMLTKLELEVLKYYLQHMSYVEITKEMNKHHRGKNRANPKKIDNSLERCKAKSRKLLQELEANKKEEN